MRRLYVRFGFCFEHNTLIGLPCEAAMVSKAQGCWPQAADPGHLLLILVRQSGIRTNCMLRRQPIYDCTLSSGNIPMTSENMGNLTILDFVDLPAIQGVQALPRRASSVSWHCLDSSEAQAQD
eukprot:scaffold133266_cov23-Tisochrysis_lutea.AAC.1